MKDCICLFCEEAKKEDELLPHFHYHENLEHKADGICEDCFDYFSEKFEVVDEFSIFLEAKESHDDIKELYSWSVVSYMYSMSDLIELARKDMKDRFENGPEIEREKVKKACRAYCRNVDEAFAEFVYKWWKKQ